MAGRTVVDVIVVATSRLIAVTLAVAVLAACANTTQRARTERVVMSQHNGWKIRVTPSFSDTANRWRARAEVWPPDRDDQAHPGIGVRFAEEARDQKVVVDAALAAARRYIDASRSEHR